MKISTKGRYGTEALFAIALYSEGDFVSLRDIAAKLGISSNYLEQLFAKLRQAGYVESSKGKHGGYRLAKSPSEINIGDVLRTLEGPLVPVICLKDPAYNDCGMAGKCCTKGFWCEMTETLNLTLDNIFLENLLEQYEKST